MERHLSYNVGKLEFHWAISSRFIEVYEMNEATRSPIRRAGMLTVERIDDEEGVVEFEQEAFEAHCDRFLEMASTAEILTEGEDESESERERGES